MNQSIKSTEILQTITSTEIATKDYDPNEGFVCDLSILDENAISVIESILQHSVAPATKEGISKTACVKFMITLQDEIDLRALGYSQAQIHIMKPQEVAEILRVGMNPKGHSFLSSQPDPD